MNTNLSMDPAKTGRVITHVTLTNEKGVDSERVFDRQLVLEIGNLIAVRSLEGDKVFVVTDVAMVVVDSPRTHGDIELYSTFVSFVTCEAVPDSMPEEDAPLSAPRSSVSRHKEKR